MTTPPFNHDWEKQLHEKLQNLPDMEAPDSLIPNVMAAIRARQEAVVAAWYRRPATTWPGSLQALLGVFAVGVFLLAVFGAQQVLPEASALTGSASFDMVPGEFSTLWSTIHAMANAISLVLRDALGPLLLIAIAGACFSYLALLGVGSAIWRTLMQHQTL